MRRVRLIILLLLLAWPTLGHVRPAWFCPSFAVGAGSVWATADGKPANGWFTLKTYGPDVNGVYGGMQGMGGLEGTITAPQQPSPIVSDIRGNGYGVYDTVQQSLTWFASRPTGYGAVPAYRPLPLGQGAEVGPASAWRGKWADITGLYWLGARYYDPIASTWISFDAAWNGGDPNGLTFCGGDAVNRFDPDGRCGREAWAYTSGFVGGLGEGALNIAIGVGNFARGITFGLGEQISLTGFDAYDAYTGSDRPYQSAIFRGVYSMGYEGRSTWEMAGEGGLQVSGYRFGNQIDLNLQNGAHTGDYSQFSQNMGTVAGIALSAALGPETQAPLTGRAAEAAETTALRNPNVYEALYETPISGTTRTAQRASANEFLANQLRNDAQLNGIFNQQLGGDVLQHMESGSSGLLNPPGTVWHHPFDNPNVMQLLRTSEHTAPSLRPVLHPGGVGGFGNFYGPQTNP